MLKTARAKNLGKKTSGKVRDHYVKNGKRILVTTDRISAFDSVLGHIPHKGKVLNLLSKFWFEKTTDIIENHMLSVPHPNVMVAKNTKQIPVEMVVRGYITGVTGTSIWGSYERGERTIYGLEFPDGLLKNQILPKPVITPTTKPVVGHDERLTRDEIISKNIVSEEVYSKMEDAALKLFNRGQELAKQKGLILVDTKYEFGLFDGRVILIDEIHTPDSSRFWIEKTYKSRFESGMEPENFDKEFLRLWYKERGYTGEGKPPEMTQEFINEVSQRYIDIYEIVTGETFNKDDESTPDSLEHILDEL